MRLGCFRWTQWQWLAVLLAILMAEQGFAQQPAQKAQPADKSIEASGYLAQADREVECNPEGARNWARKALDTSSAARETDPAMRDAVGDLKSQSNIKMAEAWKRLDVLNEAARHARGLAKLAKLDSAETSLTNADPKSCYEGFKSVKSEIAAQKARAEARVKEGDAAVERKPKNALKIYASAKRIDIEYPGLDQKISHAEQVRAALPKSHKKAAIIALVVIAAGVGALVYALTKIKSPND